MCGCGVTIVHVNVCICHTHCSIVLTHFRQEKFFVPRIRGLLKGKNSRNEYSASAEPLLVGEDDDVHAERKRVLSGSTDERDVVIIKNLVKVRIKILSGFYTHSCLQCILLCVC